VAVSSATAVPPEILTIRPSFDREIGEIVGVFRAADHIPKNRTKFRPVRRADCPNPHVSGPCHRCSA